MPSLVRWHSWDYTHINAKDLCSKDAMCPSRNKRMLFVIPLIMADHIFSFLISQIESQSLGVAGGYGNRDIQIRTRDLPPPVQVHPLRAPLARRRVAEGQRRVLRRDAQKNRPVAGFVPRFVLVFVPRSMPGLMQPCRGPCRGRCNCVGVRSGVCLGPCQGLCNHAGVCAGVNANVPGIVFTRINVPNQHTNFDML